MGAWGTGIFENDDALDWVYGLEEHGISHLRSTLSRVARHPGADYLDTTDGAEALAAAAVVAGSLATARRNALTEDAVAWLDAGGYRAGYAELNAARLAIGRVLSDNSEIRDLWEETEHYRTWMKDVRGLLEFINLEAEEVGDSQCDGEADGSVEAEVLRETEHYTVYRGYISFVEDVWGPGIFEHRDAVEYACALEGKTPRDLLDKIREVARSKDGDWLLMTDACEALVAMALLTALEHPGYLLMLPPEGHAWLAGQHYQVTEADRRLCSQCLARIFRHKSEWIDYWDGDENFGNARRAVFEMARGLGIICEDGDVATGTKFIVSVNHIPPGLANQPVYRPQHGITTLVQALAVLVGLVMLATIGMEIYDQATLILDKGLHSLDDPVFLRNTIYSEILDWIWVCGYIALFLAFPIMISRRHANLPALAAHGIGYGPGKALFSTVIPWIGWFTDYAAVQDVLRASHPAANPADPVAWKNTGHYWPVGVWWLGWSYMAFIRLILGLARTYEEPGEVQFEGWIVVIASILMIVLMAMIILITRELTRRQHLRREVVAAHAAAFGLTADDYTLLVATNVRSFGGHLSDYSAPAPARRRDNLRIEKRVLLAAALLYVLGLAAYAVLATHPQDRVLNLIFSVLVGGAWLYAAWRVFFGGVVSEKRGCIGLTALCIIAVLSLLFGFGMYNHPAALAWYTAAFALHVWLLTITVRDAKRWSNERNA